MKTITSIIFLVLLSLNVNAQDTSKFSLPVEVGQGFVFENYHNPQWYSTSITVNPTYSIFENKLHLSEITMAIFSDGLTDYYAGGGVAYTIFRKKNYNIQLRGSALIGTRDKRLYGGGVKLESGEFFISVNGMQEYSQKRFYFSGGFGYTIF